MKNILFAVFALMVSVSAHADLGVGKWVGRGVLSGLNGRSCSGTVGVYERNGSGGDCEYLVGLQRLSVSGVDTLEVVPTSGSTALTPPYFVLRNRASKQTYVFRGACGALWQQLQIVDLSRSPASGQAQCIAPFFAPVEE